MENGNEKENKKNHTGWFSLGQLIITSVMVINEALKPLSNFYYDRKEKQERATWPKFEEEDINLAYRYYKENGDYPAYLEKKYQEKYPRLHDIFLGNVTLEDIKKQNPSMSHARNSNILFASPPLPEKTDTDVDLDKKEKPKQGLG